MKFYIKYLVVFLISVLVITNVNLPEAGARVRKAKVTKVSKKSLRNKSKRRSKSKRSRKTKRRSVRSTTVAISPDSSIEVLSADTMAPGVIYQRLLCGNGKSRLAVHFMDVDISDPLNDIHIVKAGGQIAELRKLQSINHVFDSLNTDKQLLASVNANFWKAYTNYAMGPVISDGEVVEMRCHGRWTSAFFDTKNRMYIDRFKIYGKVRMPSGKYIAVDEVNHRNKPENVVVYNCFAGDSVPFIAYHEEETEQIADTLKDLIDMRDSTDLEYDSLQQKQTLIDQNSIEMTEYRLPKIILRYLTLPAVNKKIKCIVSAIDSGCIKTDDRSCILSMGSKYPLTEYPRIGDTVILKYETNSMANIIFTEGVSGTPRLIRNGVPDPESKYEFSTNSRFVGGALPRTAIGTDSRRSHIYIAVVEPGSSDRLTTGASLSDIAKIMRALGAYNAMNLDGGGSSIMVIDEENVLYPLKPDAGRRISVALCVLRKELKKYYQSINKKFINNNPKYDAENQKMFDEVPTPVLPAVKEETPITNEPQKEETKPATKPAIAPAEETKPATKPAIAPAEEAKPATKPAIAPAEEAKPATKPAIAPAEEAKPATKPIKAE